MPYLGDYLGQLLSEITLARMQADLETVRLAELYAAHPLLRTMPVPHVRLPDVELDVPVLIEAAEPPRPGESTRGGASMVDIRSKFDEVLAAHLAKAGVELSAATRKRLNTAVSERLERHGVPAETAVDVHRVADDLVATALGVMGEPTRRARGSEAAAELPEEGLRDALRLELLKLRSPPPRLMARVTTAEIREAGEGANLTRLRLKVTEQGLEWTRIESEGVSLDRLVPE